MKGTVKNIFKNIYQIIFLNKLYNCMYFPNNYIDIYFKKHSRGSQNIYEFTWQSIWWGVSPGQAL